MHKAVYMAAPAWDSACADAARGQRSLLVFVVAQHLVLAVLLQAYDEEIEDDLAGTRPSLWCCHNQIHPTGIHTC